MALIILRTIDYYAFSKDYDQPRVMQGTASSSIDRKRTHDASRADCKRISFKDHWAPWLSMVIAVGLALFQCFLTNESRATFFGDSGHYLETCWQLVDFLRSTFLGLPGSVSPSSLANHLMMDGPILPLPAAIFFSITGKTPATTDWPWFVVAGCLLHGVSALLTCNLAYALTRSRKWSFVAGLMWATFPPALVALGRYLTEVPTTALLLTNVWITSRLIDSKSEQSRSFIKKGLSLGVLDGCLLLLKPVLLPVSLAVNILAAPWINRKTSLLTGSASLLAGFLIVVVAWSASTKALSGTAALTPNRALAYNIGKGIDTSADGLMAQPNPQSTAILTQKAESNPLKTILTEWQTNPSASANLTLRKFSRLWWMPWNDFRVKVFGVPAPLQDWWQCILVSLSAVGIVAIAAGGTRRSGAPVSSFVGYACILVLLGHLIYLPFEAIARYGHTSMPFVVILATYGLFAGVRFPDKRKQTALLITGFLALLLLSKVNPVSHFVAITGDFRCALLLAVVCQSLMVVALSITIFRYLRGTAESGLSIFRSATVSATSAAFLLAIVLAFFIDARQTREWSCTLPPGQSACRVVTLDADRTPVPAAMAAVVIDGDKACSGASVSINGHLVKQSPELLLRLQPSSGFSLLCFMRNIAASVGLTVDEIRQWRAVSFPASWLNTNGLNEIRLTNNGNAPITLYGDYADSWQSVRRLPSPVYFSPTHFFNSMEGSEGRQLDWDVARSIPNSSSFRAWENHRDGKDLSDDPGLQTGQYRVCLMLPSSNVESQTVSDFTPPIAFKKALSPKDFDPNLSSQIPGSELRMNKYVLKHASRFDSQISVPPELSSSKLLRIKMSGDVRAVNGESITSLIVRSVLSNSAETILPATPPYIKAGSNWTHFEICDIVPTGASQGKLRAVNIELFPGAWEQVRVYGCDKRCRDVLFKDLNLEIEPIYRPHLDSPSLVI